MEPPIRNIENAYNLTSPSQSVLFKATVACDGADDDDVINELGESVLLITILRYGIGRYYNELGKRVHAKVK